MKNKFIYIPFMLILILACNETSKLDTSKESKQKRVKVNDSVSAIIKYDINGVISDSINLKNNKKYGLCFETTPSYVSYAFFQDGKKNGPAWKIDHNGIFLVKCNFIEDEFYGDYYTYNKGNLTQYSYVSQGKKRFLILFEGSKIKEVKGSPVISKTIEIISKYIDKTTFLFNIELAIPDGYVMDVLIRAPDELANHSMFYNEINYSITYCDTIPTLESYDYKIEYYLLDSINRKVVDSGIVDWNWKNLPYLTKDNDVIAL